ncbi:uncharacterized protein PV06_04593 [Exophiala oligosperma]|uniref:DASH complex subunit SPC34 n=1 Tax=Exophiala oligosperma TaxID=215243 RepID=A0A0D2DM48_9EURO|nr:uncharacterized protein PV06_04593 [Exophiala oligosperma]KIW43495.1 hypothetical protein PV06_04593 [Exophiala oligosperma]
MALLGSHLEQITLSAKSIAGLEFLPPKIFSNALLKDHEITTLIRDTESHERALFTLDPNAVRSSRQSNATQQHGSSATRNSLFPNAHSTQQSVVTRLLGDDMLEEIRLSSKKRDGVNVEVLLRGAERLCDVYAVGGAPEKIRALRTRYEEVATSISTLEEKVSKQQALLERRNKSFEVEHEEHEPAGLTADDAMLLTEQDFQNEEDEIRELEARKKALEDRVSGMERDLGGLLR